MGTGLVRWSNLNVLVLNHLLKLNALKDLHLIDLAHQQWIHTILWAHFEQNFRVFFLVLVHVNDSLVIHHCIIDAKSPLE